MPSFRPDSTNPQFLTTKKEAFNTQTKIEDVGGGVKICVSAEHTFGTDAFLLSHFARPKASDIACDLGSGCGVIPLLWFRGENAPRHVDAVDIREQAVEQMKISMELSGLGERFEPVLADMRDLKGRLGFGGYGLVTCNPPYKTVGTGVMSKSETDKIARHETLCTIDDCCAAASRLLRFGGRFCVCQLTERLADVIEAMRRHKLEPKRLRFVQKDKDSAPWLVLVEGKRGSKPFLSAEPTLLLYEDGEASAEMRDIYSMFGKI